MPSWKKTEYHFNPLEGGRSGAAPRYIWPLAVSIEGTENERRYFYSFLKVVGFDPDAAHVSTLFVRLIPQFGHYDTAIKHAVIALGCAYEMLIFANHYSPPHTMSKLECFILNQYNKGLHELRKRVLMPTAQNIETILITCMIFVMLECLRGNCATAILHLNRGIQLFEQLTPKRAQQPPESFPNRLQLLTKHISLDHWLQIIAFFGALQVGTISYGGQIKPVLALHVYRLDGQAAPSPTVPSEGFLPAHTPYAEFRSWAQEVTALRLGSHTYGGNVVYCPDPDLQHLPIPPCQRANRILSLQTSLIPLKAAMVRALGAVCGKEIPLAGYTHVACYKSVSDVHSSCNGPAMWLAYKGSYDK